MQGIADLLAGKPAVVELTDLTTEPQERLAKQPA